MKGIIKNRNGSIMAVVLGSVAFLVGVLVMMASPLTASASVGSGAGGISGNAGGLNGAVRQTWQTGDMDAWAMYNELRKSGTVAGTGPGSWPTQSANHYNRIFENWNNMDKSSRASKAEVLRKAITDCGAHSPTGKCNNPRVVTIGILQATDASYHGGWGPAIFAAGKDGKLSNMMPNYTWKVNGQNISKNQKLGNKRSVNDAIVSALNSNGNSPKGILFAVIDKNDVAPKKGWKPTWADYTAFDIKTSSNETNVSPVTGVAEYSIQVEGYDGYVKGMASTPKSYQTPFGSLVAAVNSGKNDWTWNGGYGTERRTFHDLSSKVLADRKKDDPSGAVRDANNNIKNAANWAIAQTEKMNIDFKIDDAPGVNGMSGREINELFKKGGQYKIVKKRKLQTINFKGMNVDYWRRPLSGYYFNGWVGCHQGQPGCGHIGKPRPSTAPATRGKDRLGYRIAWKCPSDEKGYNNCIYKGPVPHRGNWEKLPHDGNDRTFYKKAITNRNFRWGGRILWTIQSVRSSTTSSTITLGRNYKNGVVWLENGNDREAYAGSDKESWINTTHFKPAPNSMQSPIVVALQDFIHLNCNKADFDRYVGYVRSLRTPQGDTLLDEGSVKSTKFDGYMNTKLVTHADPTQVRQQLGGMTTVLMQQPGNTVFKPGDKLTNGRDPNLVNWRIQWGSTKWNTTGKNSGQIDPTYTKECPFDCVADTSTVRTNIRRGVANDPATPGNTRTDPDTLANDAYGVQVWPNKNGQTPDLNGPYKANTSRMQFFRNNEWNYFTVDRWAPVSANGINYNGSEAKSTTIVRDGNGTPWLANGRRITDMDANVNGWKALFNGTGNIVNQWSHSTGDRFDTKNSIQIGGQATQFRIRSAWATENGRPLRFNVKWEYEADSMVRTPTVWNIRNNGSNLDTVTVTTTDKAVKVDGKCDSQFNKAGQTYRDHTDYAQQGTGATRVNAQDSAFADNNDMQGWFSITFVRAAGE